MFFKSSIQNQLQIKLFQTCFLKLANNFILLKPIQQCRRKFWNAQTEVPADL